MSRIYASNPAFLGESLLAPRLRITALFCEREIPGMLAAADCGGNLFAAPLASLPSAEHTVSEQRRPKAPQTAAFSSHGTSGPSVICQCHPTARSSLSHLLCFVVCLLVCQIIVETSPTSPLCLLPLQTGSLLYLYNFISPLGQQAAARHLEPHYNSQRNIVLLS